MRIYLIPYYVGSITYAIKSSAEQSRWLFILTLHIMIIFYLIPAFCPRHGCPVQSRNETAALEDGVRNCREEGDPGHVDDFQRSHRNENSPIH
ncbi:hypothetical protein AVEN_179772-1 [Araneus ventricosus]|uniref:Uncharacterized protein n=1 Tax=Araneus ventricosus TaxID=182803 RepID=A0A4Y2UY29_ARAVE|nr:hypothetical protein AVEN_179772-1 [Araneus ventricosus]